jgi:hypothetical protein
MFSEHAFMAGRYANVNGHDLDVSAIRHDRLAFSVLSREASVPVG